MQGMSRGLNNFVISRIGLESHQHRAVGELSFAARVHSLCRGAREVRSQSVDENALSFEVPAPVSGVLSPNKTQAARGVGRPRSLSTSSASLARGAALRQMKTVNLSQDVYDQGDFFSLSPPPL